MVGGSDCELIRDGVLAQPVNALSSLAFLPAAVLVARRAAGAPRRTRLCLGLCAGSLVAVAVGSLEYHGFQHPTARLQHDLSLAAALGTLVLLVVLRERGGPPPSARQRRRLALLVVAALAAYAAGRTGSPLCRPASVLQPHAGWHVLTAAAAVAVVGLVVPRSLPSGGGGRSGRAARPSS